MAFNLYRTYRKQEEAGEGKGAGTGDAAAAEAAAAEAAAAESKAAETKAAEEKAAAEAKAVEDAKSDEQKAAEKMTAADKKAAEDAKTPEQKAADKKVAEEKAAEEKAAADKKAAEEKGEITYEDFTIPEEYQSLVNEDMLGKFKELAEKKKLTQEEAQEFVDLQVEQQKQAVEDYALQVEQWGEDVKTDKELGGANFDLKMGKAAVAVKALASENLQKMLDPYHPVDNPTGLGLGNHPEMVRLFYHIGSQLSEDQLVSINTAGSAGQDNLPREDIMYPNKKTG